MRLISYEEASPTVRAVFDDIKATRDVPDVNNFWKALANDPATLKRTWESIKEVMAPGALEPLTKELIYLAVSVTNGCEYCIASHHHAARKAGLTDAMWAELLAVIAMANETNRLAAGWVPVDPAFRRLEGVGRAQAATARVGTRRNVTLTACPSVSTGIMALGTWTRMRMLIRKADLHPTDGPKEARRHHMGVAVHVRRKLDRLRTNQRHHGTCGRAFEERQRCA